MTRPGAAAPPVEMEAGFSLVAGGPFHGLLGRLGLLGADRLPDPRAGVALAAFAWLLPAALALGEELLAPSRSGPTLLYFRDFTAATRSLVAILVMVATERYADGRLRLLVRHFRDARLVPPESSAAFTTAVLRADRRTSSLGIELGLLAFALFWPGLTTDYVVELAGTTWEGALVDGQVVLSWAGAAARYVSTPLFLFLVLRWLFRFAVWTGLLYGISRMRLHLTPLHPDRSAGLGFLSLYPTVFSGFALALSCTMASFMVREMSLVHHEPQTVWIAMGGWLAFLVVLFVGPLAVFSAPLWAAREQALLDYGRLANQHHLAFDRRWVDPPRDGADLVGSPEPSSTADLNASIDAIRDMRMLPVDRQSVMRLVVPAAVPLVAVVAHLMPLLDFVKLIFGAVA